MLGEAVPGDTSTQVPWYQSILGTVAQLGTQYLNFEQQKELMRIQNERARQGLPPLDVSQYAPGVQVAVSQSTERTVLTVAVIGVVGLIAYGALRR